MTIEIDYNNEGWENVNIETKLEALTKLCNEDTLINYSELSGAVLNKVFRFDFPSKKVVIKISPFWYNKSLSREAWCYSQITKRTSVRVPEVFSYTPSENTIFSGHEILVMEYIPGHLLSSTKLDKRIVHKQMGEILKQVHSIPMYGYGWLKEDFTGMYPKWPDFLTNINNIKLTIKENGLSSQEHKWLVDKLIEEVNSDFKPRLLHGDFRKENIIVHGSTLVPIDFQNCFSGDCLYDIGVSLHSSPDLLDYVNYYTTKKVNKKELRTIVLYAMRHTITVLGHKVSTRNLEEIEKNKRRFRELKEIYCILE